MAIVTLEQLKQQLNVSHSDYDDIIERKLEAAQNHIDRLLGYQVGATYGGAGQPAVPPALIECVCQLAAHWYENREATVEGNLNAIPFGIDAIVNEYREWSF